MQEPSDPVVGSALAIRDESISRIEPVPIISESEWMTLARIAQTVANTEFVPKGLRGNGPKVMACLLFGRSQGIEPMVALSELHVVDGRVGMSAAMIVGKIRQAGHKVTREEHWDDARQTIVGITAHGERADGTKDSFTFTLAMAERAELLSKWNWVHYPEAMLWARAVSQLGRMLFSDVFLGMAVYDYDDVVDADVSITAVQHADPLKANPAIAQWQTLTVSEARVALRSMTPAEIAEAKILEEGKTKPRVTILSDVEQLVREMSQEQEQEFHAAYGDLDIPVEASAQGAESPGEPGGGTTPDSPEGGGGEEPPGDEAPTPGASLEEALLDAQAQADADAAAGRADEPVEAVDSEEPEHVRRFKLYLERIREIWPDKAPQYEEEALLVTVNKAMGRDCASFAEFNEAEFERFHSMIPDKVREQVDQEIDNETQP